MMTFFFSLAAVWAVISMGLVSWVIYRYCSARPQPCGPSAFTCETCDAPIPEARRALVHGVTRCVTCQEIHEAKARHIRGNP